MSKVHCVIPDVQAKPGLDFSHLECSSCKRTLPIDNFPIRKGTKLGYRRQCKDCRYVYHRKYKENNDPSEYQKQYREKNRESILKYNRDYFSKNKDSRLKKKYGITLDDYNELLNKQENRCAICRDEFVNPPQVDHSHSTGKVRGLLCGPCNLGLGKFRDSVFILDSASFYLRETM